MRFGKKSKNIATTSRRFFGERPKQDRQAAGLAVQTLEPMEDEENAMTPPPREESTVAGDPTQRLLTALGRFQRQVTRAEEGAPQETWCDECMNQLISGIEISVNEDWVDVKEALTDAARILATYERADSADRCVRFLKDSYEILCLMVGDLIVGNARSGVMKKWQERYERALDELAEAGLTLVDDDESGERETAPSYEPEEQVQDGASDDFDQLLDQEESGDSPDSIFDSEPAPGGAARAFRADPDDPFAPVDDDAEDDAVGSPFEPPADFGGENRPAEELPSLDALLGRPVSPEDDLDEDEPAAPAPELSDDFTAETEFLGEEDEDDVDSEALMETGDTDTSSPEETREESSSPGELDFGGDGSMEDVEDESPFETGAAAAEPDALMAGGEEEADEPQAAPAPVVEVAIPAPAAEPEPGTPEALWRTAQLAMAAGNVADAKLFALQLAANMAKLEADQVGGKIAQIEAEIERNSEAITAGELAVNEAEARVRKLEEEAARCQQEFEEKQQHTGTLREEVGAVESAVDDLNRQIAELEARRDAEAERLATCQANLEESMGEEGRMQVELESIREEESGSRENLDGARAHVQSLQEAAAAHASSLESTQQELAQRRRSVEDIENTIRHVGGAIAGEEKAPEQTELLAEGAAQEEAGPGDGGPEGPAE